MEYYLNAEIVLDARIIFFSKEVGTSSPGTLVNSTNIKSLNGFAFTALNDVGYIASINVTSGRAGNFKRKHWLDLVEYAKVVSKKAVKEVGQIDVASRRNRNDQVGNVANGTGYKWGQRIHKIQFEHHRGTVPAAIVNHKRTMERLSDPLGIAKEDFCHRIGSTQSHESGRKKCSGTHISILGVGK